MAASSSASSAEEELKKLLAEEVRRRRQFSEDLHTAIKRLREEKQDGADWQQLSVGDLTRRLQSTESCINLQLKDLELDDSRFREKDDKRDSGYERSANNSTDEDARRRQAVYFSPAELSLLTGGPAVTGLAELRERDSPITSMSALTSATRVPEESSDCSSCESDSHTSSDLHFPIDCCEGNE